MASVEHFSLVLSNGELSCRNQPSRSTVTDSLERNVTAVNQRKKK